MNFQSQGMWFFKGPSLLWIQNFNNFQFLISIFFSNHILKHVIDKHEKKKIVVKTCKRKGLGKWFDHFEAVLTYTTKDGFALYDIPNSPSTSPL
jgi:hypothetical protein